MPRVLIDEDLPRSLVRVLREAGTHAEDVRDVGLRGRPDDEVLRYAASHDLALLTADLGFGNILRFPLGSHAGVVVARLPTEMPTALLNVRIVSAVRGLSDEEDVADYVTEVRHPAFLRPCLVSQSSLGGGLTPPSNGAPGKAGPFAIRRTDRACLPRKGRMMDASFIDTPPRAGADDRAAEGRRPAPTGGVATR